MSNPNNAAVQHTVFRGRSVADCLADVGTVCAAGAQSPDVQNSPPAQQALVVLQKAVTTANASLNSKLALVQALVAATKSLEVDFGAVKDATTTYESAVNAVAAGNATVITKAGLLVRGERTPPAALGEVSVVHTKPGKHTMEAILNWPKTPGATGTRSR